MDVGALRERLGAVGLNRVGVASAAAWDATQAPARRAEALCPGARAVVVVGNGGSALWDAFLADLRGDPRGLTDEPDPLDAFVRRAVLAADAALGAVPRRWVWAAADADVHVDFRLLAHLGGLGAQSRLGLLIDREWGTWTGLRAACFVGAELAATGPVDDDICAGCPAPCGTACPGGAFPGGMWAVDPCVAFHQESAVCARSCAARLACPVGTDRRYRPEHYAYHAHRESGRRWLRAHLGIPAGADRFEGTGPYWGDWRARVDVKGEGA